MNADARIKLMIGELAVQVQALMAENEELKAKLVEAENARQTKPAAANLDSGDKNLCA